jgi:hypothetical protein
MTGISCRDFYFLPLCFSGEQNERDCLGLRDGRCRYEHNQTKSIWLTHNHQSLQLRFFFTISYEIDPQDIIIKIEQICTTPKRPRGLVDVGEQKETTEAILLYPLTLGPRLEQLKMPHQCHGLLYQQDGIRFFQRSTTCTMLAHIHLTYFQ